jgi:uncharacterized protein YigE (DUF2233 family)
MKVLLTLALLAAPLAESAAQFTVVRVDARVERIELFWRDQDGAPFRRLDRLNAWLGSQNKQLRFAVNAGMFEPDLSPVGLFITHGTELKPLNLAKGKGNFFLKPNGVFFVTVTGPQIVESSKYSAALGEVVLATQSGPLLLERGVIHPAFNPASKSKVIRNGVGIRGNEAIFVISDVPVSFYELATYFRDQLHCQDALYLDGVVSALFESGTGRRDSKVDLGPMIGVVR